MAASDFLERVRLDGQRMDANVAGSVVSAKLRRPYDGATNIELVLADPDFALLRSGVLSKKGKPTKRAAEKSQFDPASWAKFGHTRLVVDGVSFRLAGVSGGFDPSQRFRLTLTFEDEVASKLRRYKRRVIATRTAGGAAGLTRAQFIGRLCRIASVPFDIPERFDVQPEKGSTAAERAKTRRRGIDKNAELFVKGIRANRDQIKHMEEALAVADEEKAGERATLAMLAAGIGESGFREIMNTGGSGYGGVFQGDVEANFRYFEVTDTEGQAFHFLRGGKGFQQGGAISLARDNPNMSIGEIVYRVEGSISNFSSAGAAERFYGQWKTEAEAILAAWGGAGRLVIDSKTFEFRNEKGHAFWATQGGYAREVNVRHFATENVLHYVSDDFLLRLMPVFTFRPGAKGILGFNFDADVGMPIAEMTWTVRKPPWTGRAGVPVSVTQMGPLDGRWLLANAEEDLLEIDPATITLHRPAPQLREPARTIERTVVAPDSGTITTVGGAKGIVDQAANLAEQVGGSDVYVGSGFRGTGERTATGNLSDHGFNDSSRAARDIGVRGINLITGPPSPKLDRAIVAIGEAFDRDYDDGRSAVVDTFYWNGYRIQLLWRTNDPQGHMGHIHIGVQKL